jgi:urease accessory protein
MMTISFKKFLSLAIVAAGALAMMPAFAHPGHPSVPSFHAGFSHPFSGMDHLLAMIAVGLWASQNKRPALWVLPVVFPLAMALGAAFGIAYGSFSGIESGIAATVAILGLFVAFACRLPIVLSAAIISVFAMLHGYAHGAELPHGVSSIAYVAGFMLATALLHTAGLGIGLLGHEKSASRLIRVAGAAIASAGVVFMIAA